MNSKTIPQKCDTGTAGTHLQGYVETSFSNIVSKLGLPHSQGDEYKMDAWWCFRFPNLLGEGTLATLYNWKNGKTYCGESGLDLEEITVWNVGGFSPEAVDKIKEALK